MVPMQYLSMKASALLQTGTLLNVTSRKYMV